MQLNPTDYFVLVISIGFCLFLAHVKRRRSTAALPPSRPCLPVFGNFFEIPKHTPWQTYKTWSSELGCDLISVWSFGQLSIIINTQRATEELLEHRSALYSDRPQTTMLSLMGWDVFLGFTPYSDKWRSQRRVFQQRFRKAVILKYEHAQQANAKRLLKLLYTESRDVTEITRTNVASLVMDLTYDYDVSKHDPIVSALDEAADMLAQAVFPGAMAVNALPALQYLPEWLPGMHFKAYGRKCRLLMDEILQAPLAYVQRKLAAGTARPSIIGLMLKENNGSLDGTDLVKKVGFSMYAAMTDTTSMGIAVAVHAFLLHPDVQRRAQDELDVVVGRDRLPSFADRDTLPYVNAIVREVVRWKPVLPLGFPRIAIQDDIYDGKLIPKGAMILPNAWAMLHDVERYPEPEIFSPNRFLNKDGELIDDEVTPAFGFGRRICPGRHVAMSSLFINIACMLSVFSLQPKKNERGEDLPINVTYADGLSSRPSSFECEFVPRDQTAHNVLKTFAGDDTRSAKVPSPDTMT